MKRRHFILGGSAALAAPFFSSKAFASDYDVIVIGAGAAGISASRTLKRAGFSVKTIEAQGRIGGRIYTDHEFFGVPYDIGAHWLHNRESNPFADYGQANGFTIYEANGEQTLYVGNRPATQQEQRSHEAAMAKAIQAITRAARQGNDVSAASVLPDLGEWEASVNFQIGAYELARDLEDISCLDWYSAEEGSDYFCKEGIGTLFAHSARDIAVETDVTAETIRWGNRGVSIETSEGTLRAKAVIITVSTGVLASEDITFDPPLPIKTQEAIQNLPMGHYFHVALQLKSDIFQLGSDGYFSYKPEQMTNGSPHAFGALVNSAGSNLTYCDMGGKFAQDLLNEGNGAAYDFVLQELKSMFGDSVDKEILQSSSYDWSNDPFTYGSYAAAAPGGAWARKALASPIADRLFFAGEALHPTDWSTIAGAHKSGQQAAKTLISKVTKG